MGPTILRPPANAALTLERYLSSNLVWFVSTSPLEILLLTVSLQLGEHSNWRRNFGILIFSLLYFLLFRVIRSRWYKYSAVIVVVGSWIC